MNDREADANRLSAGVRQGGDPTGWFERLYREAAEGHAIVPWDRGGPHPLLVEWAASTPAPQPGQSALVVGAGPGSDAAFLAGRGYAVTAFDIAPTAVAAARARFAGAAGHLEFVVADARRPPADWRHAYDLVFESYTVQSLPVTLRAAVTAKIRDFVAPGGTLLVLAAAEDAHVDEGPPWPLTRAEVDAFAGDGLAAVKVEEILSPPDVRRWRAEFRRTSRPGGTASTGGT